jgi:hypothetical protein
MIIHIERSYTPKQTNGKLYVEDIILDTLECPWLDNKPFYSCIPKALT